MEKEEKPKLCKCKLKNEKESEAKSKVGDWLKNQSFEEDCQKIVPSESQKIFPSEIDSVNKNKLCGQERKCFNNYTLFLLSNIDTKLQLLERRIIETNERVLKSEIYNLQKQSQQPKIKKCKCKLKDKNIQSGISIDKSKIISKPSEPLVSENTQTSKSKEGFLVKGVQTIEKGIKKITMHPRSRAKMQTMQCFNKECDKNRSGDCSCFGDAATADHTIICTMSCEITKLRKDILDLKVMVANCLRLLEHKDLLEPRLETNLHKELESDPSAASMKKHHFTIHHHHKPCCGKTHTQIEHHGDHPPTSESEPSLPPKKKKQCYLSKLCKYCCIKL